MVKNALRRMGRVRRRRAVAVLCLMGAVASAAMVGLGSLLPASAANVIEGKPVDPATAQTTMVAALSCPVLTGPRLAGTMMAASGMDFNAGNGVAGLTPSTFTQWAPWAKASAADATASIYALAHYLCTLAGQVREAGIAGDRWDATLAAYHAGLNAVHAAAGVPAGAQSYVAKVNGYAAWYAEQPGFGSDSANPTALASDAVEALAGHVAAQKGTTRVPDSDVAAIRAAGGICSGVTAPMVAAQLMASSGFDANLRASTEAMGIGQFLPDMWMQYAPSVTSSPWDTDTAISVLGHTMCDLVQQFGPLQGKPYELALAAFRVGPAAVRQVGGVPPIPSVQQFVAQVVADTGTYAKDTRLTGAAPAASASPAPSASPKSSAAPASAAPPAATSTSAAAKSAQPAPLRGPITGALGMCLDIPSSKNYDGIQVQVWGCDNTPAQQWTLNHDGTIEAMGKCLDIYQRSATNGTKVVLETCHDAPSEVWVYHSDTDELVNPLTGKCLEANGSHLGWGSLMQIWTCLHGANQQWQLPLR